MRALRYLGTLQEDKYLICPGAMSFNSQLCKKCNKNVDKERLTSKPPEQALGIYIVQGKDYDL